MSKWPLRKLCEVCEIIAGQSPPGSSYNADQVGLPFYQGKKEFGVREIGSPTTWTSETTKVAKAGDILMSVRAPVGPVNFLRETACIGRGLAAIRAGEKIDRDFLFYNLLMREPEISGTEGAVFASINRAEIAALDVALPPLEDQRRIVAVLDEAFAAIATATANAEKNLANARDVFSSFVSSALKPGSDSLQQIRFGAFCQLQRGFDLPTQDRRPGTVPLVSSSGVIDGVDRAMVSGPGVVTGRSGSIGNVFFEKEDFWPLNTTLYVKDFFGNVPRFVYHFLRAFDLNRYATGAGVPTLNRNFVNEAVIWVPQAAAQQELANAFDEVEREMESVGRTYQAKIVALQHLKRSLLRRFFSGELTEREPLAA